ncbi:beta-lactamase-like protein [Thamnocephalis sphaerospora]|uniref:Beta-lactamase-like protein n=1 Tax=Thamnocephalis sphaerospora TaxID=78915 RepID=A0A4P9XW12_9FUNG|nr:beta-lactamase-like protein [Thamnocephalis sphaerospora]|eukprot:RKP10487.1 beta-lactamase-like protein [Thamnocephalis sphaerospora]
MSLGDQQPTDAGQNPQLIEIIFLGTGTSGRLPNVTCLTRKKVVCQTCPLALTPEGRKNRRRNTSILARWRRANGSVFTLLVDCGKSFYESALEWLPHFKIERIDAVFLTHGHADAMFGLDDLRSFSTVQRMAIPIYATERTMRVVRPAFPYLVDRSKATGGGDVARLDFHIIDPENPVFIGDMKVTPLPVHHGYDDGGTPFINLGLRIDNVAYIADVNYIPDSTRKLMHGLELVVLDALKPTPFTSHFGYHQAIGECRLIGARRSLLTDFAHMLEHETMTRDLMELEQKEGIWIRPAYDGMFLTRTTALNKDADVHDWTEEPEHLDDGAIPHRLPRC